MRTKFALAILVGSSMALSWACHFAAGHFGKILSEVTGDRPIGRFPLVVYDYHSILYLFPLPLLVWASILLRRKEVSPEDFHLFVAVTLFALVAFTGTFLVGLVIPFSFTDPIQFHPIEVESP